MSVDVEREYGMRVSSLVFALALITGCSAPRPSQAQPRDQAPAGTPQVLATVNGVPITEQDVRTAAGLELARLEEQIYDLRKTQLDALIDKRLLEAEAGRRGVTLEALEAAEIASKVAPVSDPEIEAFVDANRARIRGDVTQLRPQIREFLREQKLAARRAEVVGGLRSAANVDVRLAAPPVFRAEVDIDGAPIRGAATAPVTIVEYSDFHCPFCRRVQPTLTALLEKYPGRVRLVYKHLPLDGLHPQARRVSEAAWCAGQQDRFWEFHDAVYADTSNDASEATLNRYATAAGLDAGRFASCLASPDARNAVQREVSQGESLGLNSTPGFFVNGREIRGAQPLEAFVAIIDEELRGVRH